MKGNFEKKKKNVSVQLPESPGVRSVRKLCIFFQKSGFGSKLRERLRSSSREPSLGPASTNRNSMERQSSIEDEESGKTIYRPPSAVGENKPLTLNTTTSAASSKVTSARGTSGTASYSAGSAGTSRGASPSPSYSSLSRSARGTSPYSTTYSKFKR